MKPTSKIRNKSVFAANLFRPVYMAAAAVLMLSACNKLDDLKNTGGGSSQQKTNYYVRMTDAPGNYQEVNVNIKDVYALTAAGEVELNVKAGMYNLLDFQNGVDTLIATGGLGNTTVSQIRLVLGDGNTVMKDSVVYPLFTPSGMQSGIKLQVHNELKAGVAYHLLLDFDANMSVVQTGNGKFQLKPVIRVIDTALSGSVKGLIIPAGVNATITASVGGTVQYSGNADTTGGFLLKGVAAGTYDITITPVSPYLPVTINGVVVVKGQVTDIGSVTL